MSRIGMPLARPGIPLPRDGPDDVDIAATSETGTGRRRADSETVIEEVT
jgi:hypothetical protein